MVRNFKIRNKLTGLYLNKDNLKESENGTLFKQLAATRKHLNYAYSSDRFSAQTLEIVEFSLVETNIIE